MDDPHSDHQAQDPRRQLASLFTETTSDRKVGDWRITEDFFASDFAANHRPPNPADRGRAIREVAWRLIETHNDKFTKQSAAAKCPSEKCVEQANLRQWHILALLYCWDDNAGIQRQRTLKELHHIGSRAKAWQLAKQREQSRQAGQRGQPASKPKSPENALYEDPVLRRGLSEKTYKNAKSAALDALYAHLIDPDDPVVLKILSALPDRSAPGEPPPPQPSHQSSLQQPMRAPSPVYPPRALTPPDAASAFSPAAPANARSGVAYAEPVTEPRADPAPPADQQQEPSAEEYSPALPWHGWHGADTPTLPGEATTTLPGNVREVWSRFRGPRWVRIVVAFALLLACLITTSTPPLSGKVSWSAAGLSGWLVARQWIAREPHILAVLNLRTGAWKSLWPPDGVISGTSQPGEPLVGTDGLTSPSYTPSGHQLAFIAKDSNQAAAIYTATVAIGKDGWPEVAGARVRMLLECQCSSLTWSPSGRWLIYNGPNGLVAVDRDGKNSRSLTTQGQDIFPACSPDGRYLAYQRQQGGIVALSARDCLPDAGAARRVRYLNGYSPAWNPSWSPDSQTLSFVSNASGRSAVYVTPLANLANHPQLLVRDTAQTISGAGCGNPVWVRRIASMSVQPALVFGCDQPTPDDHHGTLAASSGLAWPRWNASLGEGLMNRDSLCWIPERLAS